MPEVSPLKDVAANICWVHRIEKEAMAAWRAKYETGPRAGPRTAMTRTGFTKAGFIEPIGWPVSAPPSRATLKSSSSTPSLRSRLGFAADAPPRQATPDVLSLEVLSRSSTPGRPRSHSSSRTSGPQRSRSRGSLLGMPQDF